MIDWSSTATPAPAPQVPQARFKPPPITNLGELLDWQRAALQEQLFHGGTSDANRAKLRQYLAEVPTQAGLAGVSGVWSMPINAFMKYGAEHYDNMPLPLQGAYDMVLDTATDPLTLETLDTGALAKGGMRVLKPALDALDKTHLPVWGPGIISDLSRAATEALNFGGKAIHEFGRKAAYTATGMLNRQAAEAKELYRRLKVIDDSITEGLSPKQKSAVQKILHGQVPADIVQDPRVQLAVKRRKELTDNLARMQAAEHSGGLETMLGRKFVTKGGHVGAAYDDGLYIPYGARSPGNYLDESDALTGKIAQPFRTDKYGRLLEDLGGQPILRTPRFVKVRSRLKPNPALLPKPRVNPLVVTHMAAQARKPLLPGLEDFAGHPGEFTRETYRPNYFPARGQAKVVDPNQAAQSIDLLATRNPHVLPQGEFHIPSKAVEHFEQAFDGMLKTSARAITANKARDELAHIYGGVNKIPASIREIMTINVPATGTARTVGQKAAEAIKGLVGLPKVGIVGTTPVHMFNILALLAAHAPEQIPIAVTHFARILRAGGDEAKRFQAMLPAIERGIDVATHEKGGTLLSRSPLNRLTWDWDVAAKMALAEKYERAGKTPLEAGIEATNDLVNYKNTSPLTAFLRWGMPFATFAEGGAKSIAKAAATRPLQLEAVNRATGGKFLGGGNPKTDVTSYQPPADVGRGPYSYMRSKTSDLIKLPVGLALGAIPGGRGKGAENWILSGRTPGAVLTDIATGPIPYARSVINLLPVNHGKTLRGYQAEPWQNEAIYSTTGISPPMRPKPSPRAAAPSALIDWGAPASTATAPAGTNGLIDWSKP